MTIKNGSLLGKHCSIKHWARKDITRPFGARNMYRICRETEKAVLLCPVDYGYKQEPDTFWCPKSAIVDMLEK